MTATSAPPRLTTQHDGLRSVLGAEWIKFRTVRGWLIGLLVAVLLSVLFAFLVANGKHSGICTPGGGCQTGHPFVPTGPDGEAVADSYQYVERPLTGDGTLTARVASLTGRVWTGPSNEAASLAHTRPGLAAWAKAGILLTPSTTQGARYAAVMATGSHGIRFQYDYTHDRPGRVSGSVARWLRLTRTGDTVTGYDSTNGRTWARIGTTHLAGLPATVKVGLFATSPVSFQRSSDGAATQATATFDHVTSVSPNDWHGHSIGTGQRHYYPTLGTGNYRRAGNAFVLHGSGDIAPAVATLAGGNSASDSLPFGLGVALIVLIVVATMFITVEYRRGLIRATFTATPQRPVVLAAKAVVIGAVAFVIGVIAAAVAIPLGEHLLGANGNYVFPTSPLTVARIIAGTGALLAVTAVAVLAVGTILRRSAGAIAAGIIVFVLPTLIGPGTSGSAPTWIYQLTPAASFSVLGALPRSSLVDYPFTIKNGYYPLPPWAGLLVLCGYAAAALAVAAVVLRWRDA